MVDVEELLPMGLHEIKCWMYADAPVLLQHLSPHQGGEELVFVVPLEVDMLLDERTQLFDILYSGYIKPFRRKIGNYVVYITAS